MWVLFFTHNPVAFFILLPLLDISVIKKGGTYVVPLFFK